MIEIKEQTNGNKFNFTAEIPKCYNKVIKLLIDIKAYAHNSEFVEEAIKEFLIKQVYQMERYGMKPLEGRPIKSINIDPKYKELIDKFTGSNGIFTGRADLTRQAVREKLEKDLKTFESQGLIKIKKNNVKEDDSIPTSSGLNYEQLEFLFGDVLKESPFSAGNEVFRIPPDDKERIIVKQIREGEDGKKEVFLKMLTITDEA